MRVAIILFIVLAVLPRGAFAQPLGHPHPPPPQCTGLPKPVKKDKHPKPQCIAGNVVSVSATGMVLQPTHGHNTTIIFTNKTVFQTESGPGILDGVMPTDFACVTGTLKGHSFTAQTVIFDLSPFPCPGKKPHPPPKEPAVSPR